MRFWKVVRSLLVGAATAGAVYLAVLGATAATPVKADAQADPRMVLCPDVLSNSPLDYLTRVGFAYNRFVVIPGGYATSSDVYLQFDRGYASGPNTLYYFDTARSVKRYARWYDLVPNPLLSEKWYDAGQAKQFQIALYTPRAQYSCTGWQDAIGNNMITLKQLDFTGRIEIDETDNQCDDPTMGGCGPGEGGSGIDPNANVTNTGGNQPFDTYVGGVFCRVKWTYDLYTGEILGVEVLWCYNA